MAELEFTKENYEHELNLRCAQLGALWNLLFPSEKDDWDYPDQMYRLVFGQVAYMRDVLSYYNSVESGSLAYDTLNMPAGQAPYIDPKSYEWKKETE